MTNLTISMDDELIKRARVRAIQQGTSLSAKVREFLLGYATGTDDVMKKHREEATARMIATLQSAASHSQPGSSSKNMPRKSGGSSHANTLREELYAGDYRGLDRKRVAQGPGGKTAGKTAGH